MLARYLITDRRLAGGTPALLRLVGAHLGDGIEYVQIREKDLGARPLFELVSSALALPRGGTKIVVNTRLDVALACGAHGVHLPEGSPGPGQLRALCPPGFVIGVSCHGVAQVAEAHAKGADYCLLAPVFAPLSKHDTRPPLGLEGLAAAVAAAPLPVFALGGVKPEAETAIAATGAAGWAGISAFTKPRGHLAGMLTILEGEVLALAEALPEEHYGRLPNAGDFARARCFHQQLGHLATVLAITAATAWQQAPPEPGRDDNGPVFTSKAAAIAYARSSFAQARYAASRLHEGNEHQLIPTYFGAMRRGDLAWGMVYHGYNHYGQMVVLARMFGTKPAPQF
jgi:thiamine-phosphate pyrophosphorylase